MVFSFLFLCLLSFNDSLVIPGVTYYYSISAVNEIGESVYSEELVASIPAVPQGPTIPSSSSNLQALAGVEYVYLSWDSPTDDGGYAIIEYWVYRGESTGDYDYILVTSGTEFNDTTVDGGITYYYSVVAVNTIGEGTSSAEVSATPESESDNTNTTTVTTTVTTIPDLTESPTATANFPKIFFIIFLGIPIYIIRRRQ